MWKATAFSKGGAWFPVSVIELSERFTSSRVLEAARPSLSERYPHLVKHLEQEATSSEMSRDAIEMWASAAQEESDRLDWAGAPKLRAFEESLALYEPLVPTPAEAEKPLTIAWHDHTAVIIPLSGEEDHVVLEYTPQALDEQRYERLAYRYGGPEYALETTLDWRGYFGRESAVIDGWNTMRASGRGFIASIKGTFGFVVGSVLRRLTRPEPTLQRDPMARPRVLRMSQKYPHIVTYCPDLGGLSRVSHDRAAVFVHGTVSCGIQGLKDLYPVASPPGGPIYRYEHDTFLTLEENGRELARLTKRIDAKHLLMVAHSRGGLVAKIAAHQLKDDQYPAAISVFTFGTPYLGTPLVAQGKKVLNLLYKLSEDVVGAVPGMAPLTKGFSYLVDAPTLPPGISAMAEDSDATALLRLIGDASATRSWGSKFDVSQGPSGFGVTVEGALFGALEGRAHDLVVPTASALGFGTPEPLLFCSHTRYFAEQKVRVAIDAFLAPSAQITPASSVSTGSTSPTALPSAVPAQVASPELAAAISATVDVPMSNAAPARSEADLARARTEAVLKLKQNYKAGAGRLKPK